MSEIEVGSVWIYTNGSEFKVGEVDGSHVKVLEGNGGLLRPCTKEYFLRVFTPKEQGRKDDSSKLRYSLLPSGTVNQVVQVLEFGSKKYADNNWQKVENSRTRYYDAAMRHIDAWFSGDLKDDETGLHHLAHAICCLMFLMWFDGE